MCGFPGYPEDLGIDCLLLDPFQKFMLRVLPVVLPAMLWFPWQGLCAELLYPNAGTPTHWFVSLDRDQDGYLDDAELRVRPERGHARAAADQNRDGRIDHSEFLSLLDRLYARR